LKNAIKLYLRYISVSIQSQMQYKASFIMMAIAHFAITFIDFIGVWVLFDRFGAIKGWNLPEIALFYGMIHMAFAIAEAGARGFDTFDSKVRTGEFDRILLRPRSLVLQIIGQEFQLMRIGRFTQGFIVLCWAMWSLNNSLSFIKVMLIIISILGGTFLFIGLFVLQATLSFWSVQSLEVVNMVTYGGVEIAQFPVTIYDSWFRKFFIFVVPLACVNYFPAMGVLNKTDPLNSPAWLPWVSPIIGIVFFILALQVFKFGVRHYKSTGS